MQLISYAQIPSILSIPCQCSCHCSYLYINKLKPKEVRFCSRSTELAPSRNGQSSANSGSIS